MESNMSWLTAFGAGLVSFLSPCVLPMVPTYTAFLAGSSVDGADRPEQWRFFLNSFCFLTGFTVVFVAMGATASLFGQFFFDYQDSIRKFGALFMIVMGLQMAGVFRFTSLSREYRPLLATTLQGPVGAFVLGIAFTAGWTPCTGPILASILMYAAAADTVSQGALLLFVYALGFTVPFFIIALLMNRYLSTIKTMYRWLPAIQRCAAVILIIAGILVYFDFVQTVISYFWN